MTSNHDLPVETRSAQLADVDQRQRIVDLIVAPYEQEATIVYRGEVFTEKFVRSAFNGIETSKRQVRANREHVRGMTVGKVVSFDSTPADGLHARVKIVKGPEGDQVLNLAEEDMVSISGGFKMRPSDVIVDRQAMSRTVQRAFVDHVSFVEDPAYEGAKILAVRDRDELPEVAAFEPTDADLAMWETARRLQELAGKYQTSRL